MNRRENRECVNGALIKTYTYKIFCISIANNLIGLTIKPITSKRLLRQFTNDIPAGKTGLAFEPPRGKTNNVVSEQVQHKPGCTSREDG